jgi:hypothetical protein
MAACVNTRATQKVTCTYLAILIIGTAGTEALVILGNKFLYACVKEVYTCELNSVETPSISTLLLRCYNPNQYFFRWANKWHLLGAISGL